MPGTFTNFIYHMTWSTKHREPFLTDWRSSMHGYIVGIGDALRVKTIQIGGIEDHIHRLCVAPAALSASELAKKVKGSSSKWANDECKLATRFEWQVGYAAFSVSRSQAPIVAAYIENQVEHHRHRTYREELIALLHKHGVEYDERYLLD
jgi:putative transposase